MKYVSITLGMFLCIKCLYAQSVGVNTISPDNSAVLDVSSTDKGFLMPRLSTSQMNAISGPATGLTVYNTDSGSVCMYTGSAWVKMLLSTSTAAVNYIGKSYIGKTSGYGSTGTKEGTSSNLYNINIGDYAGDANTSGSNNIALGYNALKNNQSGEEEIAIGQNALQNFTTGIFTNNAGNIAIGNNALPAMTAGHGTIAIGTSSLQSATKSTFNTGIGYESLYRLTTVTANTAAGYQSLYSSTTGYGCAAFGAYSLQYSTGDNNTAAGSLSGNDNTSGQRNTFIGSQAGMGNISGNNNTFIGYYATPGQSSLSYAVAIGSGAVVSQDSTIILGANTYSNTLVCKVGIGTSSPNSTLGVSGSESHKVTLITSSSNSTSLGSNDYSIIYSGSVSGNSITLPSAATCSGRVYLIVNHSSTDVSINAYYTANSTTSTNVAAGETVQLISDGSSNWHKIN